MKFEDWEPLYEQILDYFGFEREGDEQAAMVLSALLSRDDLALLRTRCEGKDVTVCGNAPCLADELGLIQGVVFAADGAADLLYSRGIHSDAVFTDLDGATDTFPVMNREGTIMVVHAHGDNLPLVRLWVPRLTGPLIGTTQSTPFNAVYNFGGFTDGDRAVFAAEELGAASVTIVGFNLDDPGVDPVKRGKLFWARKLLSLIGYDL